MITRKVLEYQIIKDLPPDSITTSIVGKRADRTYTYKCHFLVDQIAAYESGARIAGIEIVTSSPSKNFTSTDNAVNTRDASLINSLLISTSTRRIDSLAARNEDVKKKLLFSDKIDIFSKTVKQSLNTLKKTNYQGITKSETRYQQVSSQSSNIAFDQFQEQKITNANVGSQRVYSKLMLNGSDPAKKIIVRSSINDAVLARTGLGEIISNEDDKIINEFVTVQNLSRSQNPAEQRETQTSVVKTTTTDVLLPVFFKIPYADASNLDQITCIITIRDKDDNLIQKSEFLINHREQIDKLSVPIKLPAIGIQKSTSNSINVNVFNSDEEIASIKFYARYFRNFGSANTQEPFVKIDSLDVGDGSVYYSKKLKLKSLNANQTVIRALPALTNGILLGNFESKSFNNKVQSTQGVLYSYFNQDSVTIRLSGAPPVYEYVQLARRSVTKNEKSFTNIGPVLSIDKGDVEFIDQAIKIEHVYEYVAVLKGTTGEDIKTALKTTVRTSNYTAGTSLKATLLSQSIQGLNVNSKFNVEINLTKDTDTTLLLQNLKNAGIDNYYETEITKLSADLKNIVKVYVRRINLSTGVTTDLGIVDSGEFEDTAPQGEVYIFEGLIRSQADLLEEIGAKFVSTKILDPKDGSERGELSSQILTSTTSISKKNYTQKFFSKKSLLRGTISTGITRDYSADNSGFLSGRLGISDVVENSATLRNVTISNSNLIVADRKRRLLSFDVDVDNSQTIDFFVITSKRGDNTSTVGVCHHNPESVKQHFMDKTTDLLSGTISYIITPVLYDGTTQQEYKTQDFEVA